tara:strand:+ start:54 stop:683 length:630 start_codon:yes stop_codon:yes gene_type:complete
MSITNSTFADFAKNEIKVLSVAMGLQSDAEAAVTKAEKGWHKFVAMLDKRGISFEYLRSPTGGLGPIDGRHIDIRNFVTTNLLLPVNAEDPQAILDFVTDGDKAGKAECEFTVYHKGEMQSVNKTKQKWQSWIKDLATNLHKKIKRAEPKKTGAKKATSDTFTLLGQKIDAAIKHVKKLNPEKDESIADLDIVSILLGLETAKNHLTQK